MLFAAENAFDPLLPADPEQRARLKAIIAVESGFNPQAQGGAGDGWGLTQILPATAAALGYSGPPAGLFDPALNLRLAASLLSELEAQIGSGDLEQVFSAWNCGSTGRASRCRRADGSYSNQSYVDKATRAYAYFRGLGSVLPDPVVSILVGPAGSWVPAILVGLALLLLFAVLL